MSDLQWQDKPPSEGGWYWLETGESSTFSPRCVEVTYYHPGEGRVNDYRWPQGMTRTLDDYNDARWAGPIPEPE